MVKTLRQTDPDFENNFATFLASKREASEDVDRAAREIVERVRREGDSALIDYSRRFDRIDLEKTGIAVTEAEIDAAFDIAPASTIEALKLAHERIEKHHARQLPKDDRIRMRLALSSVRAGPLSKLWGSMFRAARQATQVPY